MNPMDGMDILRAEKEIELKNGRRIVVRRRGLGYYYQLLYWHLQTVRTGFIADKNRLRRESVREFLTARKRRNTFLAEFTNAPDGEPDEPEILETIEAVVEFNTAETQRQFDCQKGDGQDQGDIENGLDLAETIDESIENIENALLAAVSQIAARTGWTLEYILERVDNVAAFYLLHNFRLMRAGEVCDRAAAFGGDVRDYIDNITGAN